MPKLLRRTVSTCSTSEDRGCDDCGSPLTLGTQRTDQIVPTRRGPKCFQRCIPCSVRYLSDLRLGRLPGMHPDLSVCTCHTSVTPLATHAHRTRAAHGVWDVSYDFITRKSIATDTTAIDYVRFMDELNEGHREFLNKLNGEA